MGPASLVSRLVGWCFSLLLAAIAFSVAVGIMRPYLPVIAAVVLGIVLIRGWRAWQRSRW